MVIFETDSQMTPSPAYQRLIFAGRLLDDSLTLAEVFAQVTCGSNRSPSHCITERRHDSSDYSLGS